jgi:hypothetical protein
MCEQPICCLISSLYAQRSPLAVTWIVWSIIVYSIQRFIVWTVPHIRVKIFKLVPPRTYRYTSTPVPRKRLIFGVSAAVKHHRPQPVNSGFGLLMRFVCPRHTFPPNTPTTTGQTSRQTTSIDAFCGAAATAPTPPITRTLLARANYGETPKRLPSKGYAFHVGSGRVS